jgi:hypothetical protein
MNLQDVAAGAMKPSENDYLVAGAESVESLRCKRAYFKPCVWGALRALFGSFAARFEDGADYTNRAKLRVLAARRLCGHCASHPLVVNIRNQRNFFPAILFFHDCQIEIA